MPETSGIGFADMKKESEDQLISRSLSLSLSLSPHAAAVSGTVEERATDMVMMLSGMKFIFYNGTIATWNRIPHCCHIFTYFA